MNTFEIENSFFGRKSVLELLKRRVIDLKEGYRQNVAFLGNRYVGKSSILRRFIHDLDDKDIIEIYLDLDNSESDYVFTKFSASLLYNFSRCKGLPLHDDLDLLIESTKKFIPQTIESIKKIQANFLKGKIAEAYRDLISLPEVFTLEAGKFCILMIDEFHNLEDLTIPNAFQELGKKIMTQKRCLYIVASSQEALAKKILTEKLSLLFGNFEVVNVEPFDLKTSQEFIQSHLGPIKIGANLKNFLVDFTGGHPFYLSYICQELTALSALHRQEEIYLPILIQAIENTIFNPWGVLGRHFELLVTQLCSKNNRMIAPVLFALAGGKHKLEDIIKDLEIKKPLALQKINRLVEQGIVIRNGNFYYLQDKLFRYWIKYVYQKRLKAVDGTIDRQKRLFHEEFERLVNDFRNVSQKDLPSRVVELLHCFDNEAFQINGRKYKLPLFEKIVAVPLKGLENKNFQMIKASSGEGAWYIVLKEATLQEMDVNTFLAESANLSEKPQRRLIISLNELDDNARLKALQEKMWIWSESELNTLLNFYDKPYIVR
ncbi:MAG: ATP-binding protein [Candidatus Omnitrophota bacterium]